MIKKYLRDASPEVRKSNEEVARVYQVSNSGNEKPFFIFGGQAHNTSAWPAMMARVFYTLQFIAWNSETVILNCF